MTRVMILFLIRYNHLLGGGNGVDRHGKSEKFTHLLLVPSLRRSLKRIKSITHNPFVFHKGKDYG